MFSFYNNDGLIENKMYGQRIFYKKVFFELITNYQFSNLIGKNWKELILSQIIL